MKYSKQHLLRLSRERLAADVAHIYREAAKTDDGQRCMVAPHPDLHAKITEEIKKIRSTESSILRGVVRAGEPTAPGLNDGMIIPPEEFPLGTSLREIRRAAADRAPLRGSVRVIVVLVNFPDKAMTRTPAHFRDLFFSTGVIPTKSVREYFQDVTNGLIDIQGEVVGPYTLPQTLVNYAHGASGMGNALPNARTMARDAVTASDPAVNFAPYDNDGNGFVDAFIVIHAGAGGEVTGNTNDIWSHKWVLDGGAKTVDGTKIYGYLTVPEDCKIGVCCHELGHLLFGFPDLYDTDYSSNGIGDWCLMAGGSWGGGGDKPVHPSAWCKANQGWASVVNVTTNGVVNIEDVKTSRKVYRLWKDGGSGNEYFLVENRQKSGFDGSMPAGGLLIWHIDEAQAGNTDENHYKVALVQADNKRDLEHNSNRGDAGDPFPGSANNTAFNNTSSPNSKSYSGQSTCVAVNGIGLSGAVMSANLAVKCKTLKEIKELQKEHKELQKDIKEKDTKEIKEKDLKDQIKDHKETKELKEKELKEKDTKEFKEKDIKEIEKPVKEKPSIDKSAALDKGFDRPGGGGLGGFGVSEDTLARLSARIDALEAALGQPPAGGQARAFIGSELRPDLSQSALAGEQDVSNLQRQMEAGSAQAKRVYDTKVCEQ